MALSSTPVTIGVLGASMPSSASSTSSCPTRRWVHEFQAGEDTVICGPGAWALLAVLLSAASGQAEDELSNAVGLPRAEAAAGFDETASAVQRIPGLCQAFGLWTRPKVFVRDSFARYLSG